MTINDYEKQNGFKDELGHVREIGFKIVTLQDMIQARPHRQPERNALQNLSDCLATLRDEIAKTRNS